MENRNDYYKDFIMEEATILLASLAGTIGLFTVNSDSIWLKISIGFLVCVDVISTTNIIRNIVDMVKDKKKAKLELEEQKEEKTLEKVYEEEKEIEKVKTIDYEISNVKTNDKPKQLVLKK